MNESSSDISWDFIVIGTGMGGATMGYALAKAGKSVLFIEKGKASPQLRGAYAETSLPDNKEPDSSGRTVLGDAGRCGESLIDQCHPKNRKLIPFIGCGLGGSSALYGMALERFFPVDFEGQPGSAAQGDSVWPLSYDELSPYYEKAEALYRVRGNGDPLRGSEAFGYIGEPPPLKPANHELYGFFETQGLHPYSLPMACEFDEKCAACQGYLCQRNCKNDSAKVCMEPALNDHSAQLMDECEVTRLESASGKITHVVALHKGKEIKLKAGTIVLAAGALFSPTILLNSESDEHPRGLANQSDMVGRNLMRHYVDLYAIFPKNRTRPEGNIKQIAFNDFYESEDGKLGSVQSFGYMPPAPVIVDQMEVDIRNSALPWAGVPFRWLKPLFRKFFAHLFSKAVIMVSIQEDAPMPGNRIRIGSDASENKQLHLEYNISDIEQWRIERFRKRLGEMFKPYRVMVLKQAENNERIAHVCGTCKMGVDPETSVVDANNKAHGLSNLYIVDSSFFPSSGATNPSLTIAANALRVADHLLRNKA